MDGMRLVEPEEALESKSAPVCCCAHQGEPYELEPGLWVTSRNAGCRVHQPPPPIYRGLGEGSINPWVEFEGELHT
jgi:hypothetical protein